VLALVRAHKRKTAILAVVVTVFIAADVGSVLAFDQSVSVDGVRVATERETYGTGENIRINMFLVNKLDQTIDACVGERDVAINGPLTDEGLGASMLYPPDPHCSSIQPGSERFESVLDWRLLLPGVYTIKVSMRTTSPSLPLFKGNSTILIVPLA
jgi:hypothetical protein